MTFTSPMVLLFGLSIFLVMFLALLRPRLERRSVAALFLWEGLTQDTRSKRIHFKQLLDPILLLQLLSILLLVAAMASPLLSSTRQRLSSLAIVIDASASMQTMTADGASRYDLAVEEAKDVLEESPALKTSVIRFSSLPNMLVQQESRRAAVSRALDASSPTWNASGSLDGMLNALSAVGGLSSFDRVVFITDGTPSALPEGIELLTIEGGENLSIAAFTVRENPSGEGTTAFAEIANGTDEYREIALRVDDGFSSTSISLSVEPEATQQLAVPFPTSRGTVFTAQLDVADDLPQDNTRYFALDRALDLRVRWIGPPNRYLSAALGAVTAVTIVAASDEADLTVVHQAMLPASYDGSILLVNSEIQGVASLGDDQDRGSVRAVASADPLLEGLQPSDIRVFSSPTPQLPEEATVILEADGAPILAAWTSETQDVVFLAPKLETTNLPLSVDLPLLARNIVSRVVRLPAPLDYRWSHVGEAVSLTGRGLISRLENPDGEAVSLPESGQYFFPATPGIYELTTERGTFPLAVNVAPSESDTSASIEAAEPSALPTATTNRRYWVDLWPILAIVTLVLLLTEVLARHRASIRLPRWSA